MSEDMRYNNHQTSYPINKGGRPPSWFLPTKAIRVPEKYADVLKEIAREWEELERKSSF